MKQINFGDIFSKKIALTDISVIYQTNLWSVCNHLNGRVFNGFILIKDGCCRYEWNGRSADIGPGTLIYLPSGSKHKAIAKEGSLNFYRINFTVTDTADRESIVFSNEPVIICSDAPRTLYGICEEMSKSTLSERGFFKNLSGLSEILDFVRHMLKKSDSRRIGAAIDYIENHYTENIEISVLAGMCYLSEAHLFRLFKKEIGMSPVEYKNALRIKKAEELLLDMECSIGEISSLVGYENFCYFSRIFKKITGRSPSEYRKNN